MKLEIHGTRINLRPPKKSDAATIQSYAKDAAISRHTFMPHPYTIKDAHEFIRHSQSTRRKKIHYHFGIEDKKTGQLIGMIALMAANDPHHKAELGYWVGRKHWGQGIAGEAIDLILGFAFETLKLHRVQAYVFPDNEASIRVLEKAGFTCEGLLREALIKNDTFRDSLFFAILEEDWRSIGICKSR